MYASKEQFHPPIREERMTFEDITSHIPDAIHMATLEVESTGMATTPEGKFAATYLLATRNLLHPVLDDLQTIGADFLLPIGGQEYNPERSIDEIGSIVAQTLMEQTHDIPHLWARTEESAKWDTSSENTDSIDQGKRFAVIDPLDMTSSIQKKDRVQTSGISVFDEHGNTLAIGITSLVDDGFVFVELRDGVPHVFPENYRTPHDHTPDDHPLRIATLTRRMHQIRQLPLFTNNHAMWAMDCTSGFSVLGLLRGDIDTVIDAFKGNPWYEVVIWVNIANQLGFPVSDKDGNPIDIKGAVRRMIERHEGDSFRIPFVISRTQEIHDSVLPLLKGT